MSTYIDNIDTNSEYKSARRAAKKRPARTAGRPQRRGQDRRLSVRSELRDRPDVQKIARAVIAMALAQAEVEAQAASGSVPRGLTRSRNQETARE